MRDLDAVLQQLITFAEKNDNIRALVLQGSYVNEHAPIDEFSDLDPLFYVKDVTPFTTNDDFKKQFGNPISSFHDEWLSHDGLKSYTRLTLYDDLFKIDFGFAPIELAPYANEMPLYKIYLDKDNILPKPEVTDERKFFIKKPTEEEFLSILGDFFFDSSYVVKSIYWEELFFTHYMEHILHKKMKSLCEWYIGSLHEFKVNTGSEGRYFKRYLSDEEWEMLTKTYADGNLESSINALLHSFDFVHYLGTRIAANLHYTYPFEQERNMRNYCLMAIKNYIE